MEEKKDLDKLLVSYLLEELNEEEKSFVSATINTDPERRQYFEDLRNLWKLLEVKQNIDGISLNEERKHFYEIQKAKTAAPLWGEQNLKGIKTEESKKAKTFWLMRAVAVAASVLLLFGVNWYLFRPKIKQKSVVAGNDRIVNDIPKFFVRHEKNISDKIKHLLLQDGSEVLLFDQSEVHFTEPFAANKRDISLNGKATFKVAKDRTKPFTVFSGDIATTALGTEFIVTNFDNERMITVRLVEGRVVVKSVDSIKRKLVKSFYLLPGQELVYNKRKATAKIRSFKAGPSAEKPVYKERKSYDNPTLPKDKVGSWYMFNNQSLPSVFDQLGSMFGVKIDYQRKDLQKLYFIGKFNKEDSLEYILRSITSMNQLTLLKEKNRYIIRKQD